MLPTSMPNVPQIVATGRLPAYDRVTEVLEEAHRRYAGHAEGTVAEYIPALGRADPRLFGLAVTDVQGGVHDAGDARHRFSIQSISKAFVHALVVAELGHRTVAELIGVNNTGLPFNSVMAVELNNGHPMNPMVNAGAIATTALVPGDGPEQQWAWIRDGLSAFAGRPLDLDEEVHRSEALTNDRNKALARLLRSYGRLAGDPLEVVEIYTRQCSLEVTAHDLAVMGATLADGGVNPVTGHQVVPAEACRDTLAVLAATGLYERSGDWLVEIGLPAKSGVSGGIVAIAPGKGAVGAFSPPLDSAGNSVRAQLAVGHLSRVLGLNLFASAPARSVPAPNLSVTAPST